jgi:threonine dehydrogenase-like Zn-dependent dehydrogenase
MPLVSRFDEGPARGGAKPERLTPGSHPPATDLHQAEGDLPPRRPGVVPGHEVVGVVDALGDWASRFEPGQRVGVAGLRHTCGACRCSLAGAEAAVVRVGT